MIIVKKMLYLLIASLITIYVSAVCVAYFFSNQLIFPAPQAHYQDTGDTLKLQTTDGALISAVYLPNENAKYIILFSHGNA